MVIQSKWFTNLIGANGICLAPFLIIVHDKTKKRTVNHEKIHHRQYIELGWFGFYFLYLFFQLKYGYWNNPLEIEAFIHDDNLSYRKSRKLYAWKKYIGYKYK